MDLLEVISRENFCPVPFSSLILNADGTVGCCREKGTEHVMGKIQNSSLEEIWNSPKLRSWRREFLEGKITTCSNEMKRLNCHKDRYNRELLSSVQPLEVQETPPKRLTPDINGKCNLRCPMCFIWSLPNGLWDNSELWTKGPKKFFPFLEQVDLLSGEPFIQADMYRLIDVISAVNPGCKWKFTTNAHWKFTEQIKEKLDLVHIDAISISLDSLDPQNYHKIRTGNLEIALKTIHQLNEYRNERCKKGRPFDLVINATIQRQNCFELKPLLDFCKDLSATPLMQYLFEPEKLSLSTLPEREKRQILKRYWDELTGDDWYFSHRVLNSLIDSLAPMGQKKIRLMYQGITRGLEKRTTI